jgi:hypothetical protein
MKTSMAFADVELLAALLPVLDPLNAPLSYDGEAVTVAPEIAAAFAALYADGAVTPAARAAFAARQIERLKRSYQAAVEAHVEATARARNYMSAVSCASYAASTNAVWRAEAAAFIAWRDRVWESVFAAFDKVSAGGEAPALSALIASLPQIDRPA